MLKVDNINVYYGAIHAIKNVSFQVNEGEIVTLIGANGAGKTTILHTITGLKKATSGSVVFDGTDLLKEQKRYEVLLRLCATIQHQLPV